MLKRIGWAIAIVALVVAGWYGYNQYKRSKQDTDGAVVCVQNCDTPEQKAAFAKLNSGETADGQSEHKAHSAREDNAAIAAGFPPPAAPPVDAQPGQGYGDNQVVPRVVPEGQKSPNTRFSLNNNPLSSSPESSLANNGSYNPQPAMQAASVAAPAGLPTTDSRSPNAPNGLLFGGSGKYQWYRQGNLTWRVDTVSGHSCIIYATMEEWQKQVVLRNGCGRNA